MASCALEEGESRAHDEPQMDTVEGTPMHDTVRPLYDDTRCNDRYTENETTVARLECMH